MNNNDDLENQVNEWLTNPDQIMPYWKTNTIPPILDIAQNKEYSKNEWDNIHSQLLRLLENKNSETVAGVMDRIKIALEAEVRQYSTNDKLEIEIMKSRFKKILNKIEYVSAMNSEVLEMFCCSFKYEFDNEPYRSLMVEWLDQFETDKNIHTDLLLAIKILLYDYQQDINEALKFFQQNLVSDSLIVRACAANKIGKLYSDNIHNSKKSSIPTIEKILDLILAKEVSKPGIAGSFFQDAPTSSFDSHNWLLQVLEKSRTPEPYIKLFPCNIAYFAHEYFSNDPIAIQKLIEIAREDIAIQAATEEKQFVQDLKPLLIELGNSKDKEIVRLASWHLAYYYNYLHQNGLELRYLEKITDKEVDIFILYSDRRNSKSIYAIVIYPKKSNVNFQLDEAKKKVNQCFPEEIRGKVLRADYTDKLFYSYERGNVNYYQADNKRENIAYIIIGYRSDKPWNPKDYL